MKKFTLGLFALGTMILTGCSSDKTQDPVIPENADKTVAVYAPGFGSVPVPNDLLFNGTTDLTINFPVEDPNDYGDPLVAVSALDGWSTVAPIAMSFSNPNASVTLNPATVLPGVTVRVFEVLADTDYNNPLIGATPTFYPVAMIRELTPGLAQSGGEYVAVASGAMSVAVIPTRPLAPRATYLVVATNGIQDSTGAAAAADVQYAAVKGTDPLVGSSLAPIQTLVNQYENLASSAANGPAKEDIIVSFAFTTQSVEEVIDAAKALYVDFPIQYYNPATGAPAYPATEFSSLMIDTGTIGLQGAADLYKGSIVLNYMLETQTAENPTGPITGFWKAAALVPDGQGGMVANPMAGGNLTYVNKLPQVNGQEIAPLLVAMPKPSLCPKPAAGYPVMIAQHGVGGNRTQMLGLADSVAAPPSCSAMIAMDLPIHGIAADNSLHLALQDATGGALGVFEGYTAGALRERTFGIDFLDNTTGAPGPDGNVDSSGAHFINLGSLLTSRDNLRQGVIDLLTLKSAIPAMDIDGSGPDFDATQVSFFGISLGGIVGSNFVAYSDETSNAFAPIVTSPALKTAVLAVPGGGIPGLLDASVYFGDRIRAGIAAAAGLSVTDPEFTPLYQQFLLAAQTAVDSGDPINTTTIAQVNAVPTFMIRVEGDTVVPNFSPTAPLSGTDPLAAFLGLQTVPSTAGPTAGSRLISRFNEGTHGTVISGDILNVTIEMQRQLVSFVLSNGTAVVVNDPTLLN